MAVRDDRSDVKQTTAGFRGPLMVQSLTSAKSKFLSLRQFSNLDDRYENGLHDYLKYIKFGYGRASDHASKDIRSGHMTREQGIEMVRKYDHVVPSDLYYWLDYVGMKEEEFWKVANGFRDPRVWRKENGEWIKDNIWDEELQEI